jgi:hypothetical protein
MEARQGGPTPFLPPGSAPSGLASVQGPRNIPRPDTEVTHDDQAQQNDDQREH